LLSPCGDQLLAPLRLLTGDDKCSSGKVTTAAWVLVCSRSSNRTWGAPEGVGQLWLTRGRSSEALFCLKQ